MGTVETREPLETRILTEQVRMMCELAPPLLVGSVLAGALLAWLAIPDHGLTPVLLWYAALTFVVIVRWRVGCAYLRSPRPFQAVERWRNLMLGLVALTGAIWSFSGTVLLPHGVQKELIVAMFFIVASAAGMASQTPLRHGYAAVLLSFLVPYAAWQVWMGGDRVIIGLGLLVLYIPVMLVISYRQTATIEQQLRLAVEKESLAEELRRERDRASRAHRELEVQMSHQARSTQHIRDLNTELERQAAELRTANNDLEGFSYSVSHDLRAPLRAIDGFARLLADGESDRFGKDGRHYLDRIHSNVGHMAALIDDLLEFSRCGRQSLEMSRLDMESLARWAADQARTLHDHAAPTVVVSKLPAARGDERLIRQVWANLLDNAVKYSSKVAAPRITVSAREEAERIVYEIADNGVGFDNRYSTMLFGVFRRLHASRDYPGTGVGLAIVQRIVVRHGGEVWAHSEIDQGATFSFSLPKPALRAVG